MTEKRPENKHSIGYYCPEHGSDIDDVSIIDDRGPYNPETVYNDEFWLMECASYAWRHHDGWEWVEGTKFVLVIDGKEIASAIITLECNPEFHATDYKKLG